MDAPPAAAPMALSTFSDALLAGSEVELVGAFGVTGTFGVTGAGLTAGGAFATTGGPTYGAIGGGIATVGGVSSAGSAVR